jgi:predicted nucleic acid-binding protein
MITLFIDTNVLLSFYHLTSEDIEELKKLVVLVESKEIELIVPKQVENEFWRNRGAKISDAMKKLREAIAATKQVTLQAYREVWIVRLGMCRHRDGADQQDHPIVRRGLPVIGLVLMPPAGSTHSRERTQHFCSACMA